MVYGAALEMRFGGNPIEGSNPSLSATLHPYQYPPATDSLTPSQTAEGAARALVLTKGGHAMRTLLTRGATLVAALTLFVASAGPATASGQRFVQISTGDYHTCGLTSRGTAYCWGYNGDGQLGDGTTTNSEDDGPQAVIGGLKFASISAGEEHTCGLTSRGTAYCWGANTDGELGDGTTDSSGEDGPQAVIGGLKFASISAGDDHTCGLTTRGTAYCWGDNGNGELGDGTTTDSEDDGPQAVIGGLKFVSLDVGYYHTCGLTSRGAAYCWGYNGYGELGDGTTTDSEDDGPQAVIGGLEFASISSGYLFTCGLTSGGAAYCWGFNDYGQLGDGTTTGSEDDGPQAVIGGLKFASLSADSYYHTCGLTSRGAAYCWGYNGRGELGDGTTTDSDEDGPQAVIGGLKFASIQTGGYHTCGLTSRGAAYCWGANGDGQLGDGTEENSDEDGPQRVIGGLKFARLGSDGYHNCGLTSRGAAYCWGWNEYGQLGDGTMTDSDENGPQAVQ